MLLFLSGVRIKNEPVTEDESHQRRSQRASEPSGAPRRNPRSNKDEQSYQWGKKPEGETTKEEPVEVEKPNFGLSGALLKDTNTYKGVVIKYSEPLEARKPKRRWRFYVFKGDSVSTHHPAVHRTWNCLPRNCLCIRSIVNRPI